MPKRSRKRHQNVDVVGDSADRNDIDFEVFANADHVSPKVFLTIAGNDFGSILGAENNVYEDVRIGMSHLECRPSGTRILISTHPGPCPGLSHVVPPALASWLRGFV